MIGYRPDFLPKTGDFSRFRLQGMGAFPRVLLIRVSLSDVQGGDH